MDMIALKAGIHDKIIANIMPNPGQLVRSSVIAMAVVIGMKQTAHGIIALKLRDVSC